MKFSYFQTCDAPCGYPMGLDDLMHLLTAPETKKKVDAVRGATDPKTQYQLKKELPFVLFQSYSVNGLHQKTTCLSNGCVSLDIDHLKDDPRQFFEEHILPHKENAGLRMAYISARGHGLHLVCDLMQGTTTIEENITEFSELFGVECDAVCHDFSRGFFLTSKEDLLYLDEKMFSDEPRFTLDNPDFDLDEKSEDDTEIEDAVVVEELPAETSAPQVNAVDEDLCFRGVPIQKIMADYWESRGGVPMQGERHNETLKYLHRHKYICGFDADKMRRTLGNAFGLGESEIQQMIKDVLKFPHSDKMPYDIYRILQRYGVVDDVTEVDASEEGAYPVHDEDIPLDSLPPIVATFVRIAPHGFATATIYLIMTILGFFFTRLRALYIDGQRHSPTLMMTVEAPMTSGKSFATHIFNRMMTKFKELDDIARKEEKTYEAELKRSKNKAKQPEEPKSYIRIIPGRNSVSKFLKRQAKAAMLHMISFCSEISSAMGNQKASWADKSAIYRNSFDNDAFSQDYMSDNAASEDVNIYLNFCYCGTPGEVDELYKQHVEDGTASRLIPCTIPDAFGQSMPKWGTLTRKEEHMIDKLQDAAIVCTFDENGDIRPEITVDMSWLFPDVESWLEEQRLFAVKNCDRAIDTLRKRASVIAFRMAFLAYQMCGCKKKFRSMVANFYRWAATTTLHLQYNRFGDEVNLIFEKQSRQNKKVVSIKPTTTLFDSLPDEFSTTDVERCKAAVGIKREARKIISDYVRTGIAVKIVANKWKKVV